MSEEAARSALVGGIGLLERAVSYTLGSLQLVAPDDMGNQSPCAEWDLGDLLRHMNDSLQAMHEAVDIGDVRLSAARSFGDPERDPVATLRSRACTMLGAWNRSDDRTWVSVAGCPISGGLVTATGALEIAVHGWDVARTCGRDRPLPAPLADELIPLAELLVTEDDRPHRFAAPLRSWPTASPSDRLLRFLGRDPR